MPKLNKLFISYSHIDEALINDFVQHIAPLKTNGIIEAWYDRKIGAGKDFLANIDSNLADADVICLAISASFLASPACMKEKNDAFSLSTTRGTTVIPIILSPCGWLDDAQLSRPLALPTDGKPIADFTSKDSGWHNVYNGLKASLEELTYINQLSIHTDFLKFLQDAEMLSKAYSQKNTILVDDIFTYPELAKYDEMRDYEKTIKAETLLEHFGNGMGIAIAGEDQTAKFCTIGFKEKVA